MCKSTLLDLYISYLKENGVKDNQIIKINLEDIDFDFIENYKDLYKYVSEKLIPDKMNYVFLDEVQKIPEFERACDSLYIKENVDLYITGSNAYMLSGELATLLSGRYIEIKMLPLSFKEYVDWNKSKNILKSKEEYYSDYITRSSFPFTIELQTNEEIKSYLDSLSDTIYIKDIMTRNNFSDINNLKKVSKYLFDNIGNIVSSNSIANTMTSSGYKITYHTVDNYINALTKSYFFHKCERFDVKGKNILKTGENEINFVAIGEYGEEYYQVSYSTMEDSTLKREIKSLDMIRDHNPKYLLTMDKEQVTSYNGIKKINVLDWLLNEY